MNHPPVDPTNVDTANAWDGNDGEYWADHDDKFDASLAGYQDTLLTAAAIAPTDRVVDIGCGNGKTTRDAARLASSGSALGVDLSARMIARARQRAAEQQLSNVEFVQADAQIHSFTPRSFNLALSRTGAMFFGDPVAAFSNIGGALRPDGRLVVMAWQGLDRNDWTREVRAALAAGRDLPTPPADAPGPLSLADPDRVHSILSSAGFTAIALDDMRAPMYIGSDVESAYRFVRGFGFVQFMLRDLDDVAKAQALDALHTSIVAHDTGHGVEYGSAAWIITARRA